MTQIKFLVSFVVVFGTLSLTVTKLTYVLKHERCDATFNNNYGYNFTYKCYKLSRNKLYLNISFNLNVSLTSDQDAEVLVTGYQLRSNEYRKGPIEFRMGLCSASIRKDFDIPNLLSNSNAKCPHIKNTYIYAYKVHPNASNLPPFIPEGRWKLELKYFYQKRVELLIINWYTKVEYPVFCPGNCKKFV